MINNRPRVNFQWNKSKNGTFFLLDFNCDFHLLLIPTRVMMRGLDQVECDDFYITSMVTILIK